MINEDRKEINIEYSNIGKQYPVSTAKTIKSAERKLMKLFGATSPIYKGMNNETN